MSNRESRSNRVNTPVGRALRYAGLIIGIVVGWQLGLWFRPAEAGTERTAYPLLFAALLGALAFLVTPYITIGFFGWLRDEIRRLSVADIIAVVTGLLLGGIAAALLAWPLSLLPDPIGQILPTVTAVALTGLSVIALLTKKRELLAVFSRSARRQAAASTTSSIPAPPPILLDTSTIIDGRIADLAATGVITSELIVPQFVLRELQLVADSADLMRRDRGKRGLDVLERLRREPGISLKITDSEVPEERDVDLKLVRLAQREHMRILTGDQNLERVAGLRDVQVINIHHLANVLRPPLLPGDEIMLKIVQPGREYDQGVGFLDDGTLVVVEAGRALVGTSALVTVTRTLQTGAGRMAFAQVVRDRERAS